MSVSSKQDQQNNISQNKKKSTSYGKRWIRNITNIPLLILYLAMGTGFIFFAGLHFGTGVRRGDAFAFLFLGFFELLIVIIGIIILGRRKGTEVDTIKKTPDLPRWSLAISIFLGTVWVGYLVFVLFKLDSVFNGQLYPNGLILNYSIALGMNSKQKYVLSLRKLTSAV